MALLPASLAYAAEDCWSDEFGPDTGIPRFDSVWAGNGKIHFFRNMLVGIKKM